MLLSKLAMLHIAGVIFLVCVKILNHLLKIGNLLSLKKVPKGVQFEPVLATSPI